ncbi:Alpha/beta hydrolase fold-1 [Mycena capillaripes]|nr:Alpha/beta hydrolase fold-1 [Mycena capillaripes]
MSPSKPTIIIIPGSFSPLFFYTPVIADLESHGYTVHGIELETVGRREKAPGMYDDAAAVAALVSRLADAGEDVVLVAHSYGGLVACEAAKGLAKSVRAKDGKHGGIVRIVFVTALVASEGQCSQDVFGDVTLDFVRVEGEYMVLDSARAAPANFNDLPSDEALAWASKLSQHAAVSFGQSATYAAYKDIPVSYLFCEEDKCVVPELQNAIIAKMEREMAGRNVDRHSVRAAHCVNVSQPQTVSAVVRKALGDTV